MNLEGSTLGKYQVLEKIGQGGMAQVYKGYDPILERTVALKVLRPEFAADPEFVQRFMREARMAASLKHPNLVTIHDVEQLQDVEQAITTHYIVMEFLPGHTLQEEIHRRGALPLERTIEITRALADALDHAHQRGLTHRDVKPSNIMLGPEGQVTLMDFGIVKAAAGVQLTQEGVRIGTPEYMSPEQAKGQKVDHRSDIYSLGIVLYEMLTGRVPFQSASTPGVLYCHIHETPTPPSRLASTLPPAVDRVVLQALAKKPEQRFQTAGQLAAQLEKAAQPEKAVAPRPARARPPQTPFKLVDIQGREYPLSGAISLGRHPDNHIQLSDRRISRRHAQIICRGAECQVMDLGSSNGTYVNGQRLPANTPYPLQPGQWVSLGRVATFTLLPGAAADQAEERPAHVPLTTTLRQTMWGSRERRLITLLSGSILLIALLLCLVAVASTNSSLFSGETATLTVLNDTGHDLELQIGSRRWSIPADRQRTIRFPSGEYDYTVTLDDGSTMHDHGAWEAGDNGILYLVGQEP
ncbi:MAG TPA: FHA domain-containing protein [Anaerolineae bacterium]|nr:FHA domain-containing protein [Anaerolineae bacterium]